MGYGHHGNRHLGGLSLWVVLDLYSQQVIGWSVHHGQARQMGTRAVEVVI